MTRSGRRHRAADAALSGSATPVFLLDARRRVTFFNAGCEALTGWRAEEVLGHVCEYRTGDDPQALESLTGCLCPPPEVLAGRAASVPASILAKSGETKARRMSFFPLTDASGALTAILGVILPIDSPPPPAADPPARRLHAELASLRGALRQRYGVRNLIAGGGAMRRVVEQVALARQSNAGVLLVGARGTGKEHLARTIHYGGRSAARPFVPLDCRRLAPRDLKNTLRRLIEEDHSDLPAAIRAPGTVYLAEVDLFPRDLQEMVAREFTPERFAVENTAGAELSPAGGARDETILPPRWMAGTTREPRQLLDDDTLLPEFYYLVSALTIELPPLSARTDDLPPLAQHFLEARNRGAERQIGGIDEAVWKKLREYNWPGNLDELALVIAEAAEACSGATLTAADLPFRFRTGLDAQASGPARTPRPTPLEPYLQETEREQIRRALEQAKYNKSKASELLGISRPRLYRRMEALGIEDREE